MARARTLYRLETASGAVVAERVQIASNVWTRFRGLMLRRSLAAGEGLAIRPCSQIHMFFMRFAIDVAFVDKQGLVLHLLNSIRPWRVSRMVRGAKTAIELEPGALTRAGVGRGDVLHLVRVEPGSRQSPCDRIGVT